MSLIDPDFKAWCVVCPNPAWGFIEPGGRYEIHHTCESASPSLRFTARTTEPCATSPRKDDHG